MALQTSGPISLNDIHVEAGGGSGTGCTINDADIRGLIGKGSGVTMSFNEWYGASNIQTYNQNSFANQYTQLGTSLGSSTSLLQGKISNTSYGSGQNYSSDPNPLHYARNTALVSALSGKTIQTVRTATINCIGKCDDGGFDYGQIGFRPYRYNGSFVDLGYPTSFTGNPTSGAGSQVQVSRSYDAKANMSTTDLHNFIKEGCVGRLQWITPLDDGGFFRQSATYCGYWVTLDFDYI